MISRTPEEGAGRSAARRPDAQTPLTEAPFSAESIAMASPAQSFADLTTSGLISIRRTARPECPLELTVNVFADMEDIWPLYFWLDEIVDSEASNRGSIDWRHTHNRVCCRCLCETKEQRLVAQAFGRIYVFGSPPTWHDQRTVLLSTVRDRHLAHRLPRGQTPTSIVPLSPPTLLTLLRFFMHSRC